ncbi:MAG: fatty-acid--CoA ligase [Alteromonas sp.]|jgi:acyl-CoA synthetase (AMP-forming)/AMP-acid ligase II|nr:fatty-acid--CoA ligase [Alteromonas sp.]
MHFYQALQRNATILPNTIGTSFADREHTWNEVNNRVAKSASGLAAIGAGKGIHIAILALNSDKYFECLNAIPWSGSVMVPLNIRWSVKENLYSLNDSECSILFFDDAFIDTAKELKLKCDNIKHMIYIGENSAPEGTLDYEEFIANATPMQPVKCDYDDLVGIFYTGGTTGFPKGVMLSHKNLWTSSVCLISAMKINTEGERYLHAAPMFHLADIGIGYGTVISGLTQVFIPAFTPKAVIETIQAKQVNHVLLVPTMITLLLSEPTLETSDLSSLQNIVYGASPMPEGILISAMEKMPSVQFIQAYGQSELSPLITILPAEYHVLEGDKSGKLRSAGRPGYCVSVEIRDADGRVVPTGKVGEVAACGPNVMLGYWKNEKQTQSTIVDNWVLTGDAGYMDEDGFLFLVDRVKDMIITGGENVFSAEVENALSLHPKILESIVIGIPSEEWGESVHAIIRLNDNVEITEEDVIAHCRENIANYKIPRSMEFREKPFPMTGAGKYKKNELRDPFWKDKVRTIN